MSHFVGYTTQIKDFRYLKNALTRLKFDYHLIGQTVLLPQTKTKTALLLWNKENYTLFYDNDFWREDLYFSPPTFIEKITREYTVEKSVHRMHRFGFNIESYESCNESLTEQTIKTKTLLLQKFNQ